MTTTTTDKDRIRLAERNVLAKAMGWKELRMKYVAMEEKSYPFGRDPECTNPKYREQIPDPFTDANDDYAVLEWMRDEPRQLADSGFDQYQRFQDALTDIVWRNKWDEAPIHSTRLRAMVHYNIGDYARAALKVLE